MVLPYNRTKNEIKDKLVDNNRFVLKVNPHPEIRAGNMDMSDVRNRQLRQLPSFMYGATFPKDHVGGGGATYGGALEWMEKHLDHINQATRYIQRYPNLVKERCMDTYWDFMEPLVYNNNLLLKYEEFLRSQFGFRDTFQIGDHFSNQLPTAAQFFKSEKQLGKNDYNYPVRRAFLCFDRTCPHMLHVKHLISDALEPYLCIRTNPTAEQAKRINSLDVCRAICGSVFLFLVNDQSLKDQVCLHLLSIALAYKMPVIFIRESGYKLPQNIRDERIAYVKQPDEAPFHPQYSGVGENKQRKSALYKPEAIPESADASQRIVMEKESQKSEAKSVAERTCSLEKSIREAFANSVVFNSTMFEATMGILCDRVSAVTGVDFPTEIPQLKPENSLARPYSHAVMGSEKKQVFRAGSGKTSQAFLLTPSNFNNNNSAANFDESCSTDDGYQSVLSDVQSCNLDTDMESERTTLSISQTSSRPNSSSSYTKPTNVKTRGISVPRPVGVNEMGPNLIDTPTPSSRVTSAEVKKSYLERTPFYNGYINHNVISGRMLRYRAAPKPSAHRVKSYVKLTVPKNLNPYMNNWTSE